MSLFSFESKKGKKLMLVIALNKVDVMIPNSWDIRLNIPNDEAEIQIDKKCKDIINKLSTECRLSKDNFIYYSAEKRYNLIKLLSKVVEFSKRGWILSSANPRDFTDLIEDEQIKEIVMNERIAMGESLMPTFENSLAQLLELFKSNLNNEEFEKIRTKIKEEKSDSPKIVIIGKAGVGKTTTVNALFNATFKTSSTFIGTNDAQQKEFALEHGGNLLITDMPGYGRTEKDDEKYMEIYKRVIPESDIVLLVIDASQGDYIDDINILNTIKHWIN